MKQTKSFILTELTEDKKNTSPQIVEHKKTITYANENQGPSLGQTHKCGRVKPTKQILTLPF